jgi:hypothetical protein
MSTRTEELSPDLLERVLSRLGLSATPAPDLNGLKTVYAAWCRGVPFDNIRKLIHVQTQTPGVLPGDSAQDFFEAWLKYSTGGTCWAGNGALHSLLVTLGFAAHRGVATMLVAPEDFHERHAQTRAWSPFNYELHARLIQGDSVVGIAFGHRVEYDRTGAVSQNSLGGDERKRVLIDELGIKEEMVQMLPRDTPTPPPPWPRTARASS